MRFSTLRSYGHLAVSLDVPEYTANCDALGTLRILDELRRLGLTHIARIN